MHYSKPTNWDSQSYPHLCLLFTVTLLRPDAEVGRDSLLAAPSVKAGVAPGAAPGPLDDILGQVTDLLSQVNDILGR